jgi:cell division protein FtsZ
VTVVATGLGQAQAKRQSFEVINSSVTLATGTDGRYANGQSVDYSSLDQTPAVVSQRA